jgi:hypothetical protein
MAHLKVILPEVAERNSLHEESRSEELLLLKQGKEEEKGESPSMNDRVETAKKKVRHETSDLRLRE